MSICCYIFLCCFYKQKTAYELRISDWSSDVCSSDLFRERNIRTLTNAMLAMAKMGDPALQPIMLRKLMTIDFGRISKENKIAMLRSIEVSLYRMGNVKPEITNRLIDYFSDHYPASDNALNRSEEHTSELQSLMRIPYAVFCLKKKTYHKTTNKAT